MNTRNTLFGLFAGLLLIGTGISTAPAAVVIHPPDIDVGAGDSYRLLFVSVGTRWGLSSLATLDAFVTAEANAVSELAALNVSWSVVASSSTEDARDHTNTNPNTDGLGVPIYRPDGVRIADDNADLWAANAMISGPTLHYAPINVTAAGNVSNTIGLKTHTAYDGTYHIDKLGNVTSIHGGWIADTAANSEANFNWYAISSVIPEPSPASRTDQPKN